MQLRQAENALEVVWPLDKHHYLAVSLPGEEREPMPMNDEPVPRSVEIPAPRRRRRPAKKPAPVAAPKPRAARAPDPRLRLTRQTLENFSRLQTRLEMKTRIAGALLQTNGRPFAEQAEMLGALLEEIGDIAREMHVITTPKGAP